VEVCGHVDGQRTPTNAVGYGRTDVWLAMNGWAY
jgi:hypothetical protein